MAVPTAAYLIIVLAVLVGGWALASIYFLIRRRQGRRLFWAPNEDTFVRPPATVGRGPGAWFAGGGGTGRSGVFGGGRPEVFQLRQEWRVVVDVGASPPLVEVELQEAEKEKWTPLNARLQSPLLNDQHHCLIASFLISLPSPPQQPPDVSADSPPPPPLTDLEFGTTSLSLSPESFVELVPLVVQGETLGPMEKMVNGVRMRREWVRAGERERDRLGWI